MRSDELVMTDFKSPYVHQTFILIRHPMLTIVCRFDPSCYSYFLSKVLHGTGVSCNIHPIPRGIGHLVPISYIYTHFSICANFFAKMRNILHTGTSQGKS